MDEKNKLNIGEDSVVIGNVPYQNVGNRSVVIGPTDSNGNTILNGTMAIGYSASAGENSIAIGAYAGAGSDFFHLLENLEYSVEKNGGENEKELIKELKKELKSTHPDKVFLEKIWKKLNDFKWTVETVMLIQQIEPYVRTLLYK